MQKNKDAGRLRRRVARVAILGWTATSICSASPALYVLSQPDSLAGQALVLSMQGLIARDGDNRIWIERTGDWFDWPALIEDTYGYSRIDVGGQVGRSGSTIRRAASVANQQDGFHNGYILCDLTNNPDSLYVALSLAGPMRMLVVDESIREEVLAEMGPGAITDVRGKLLESLLDEYAGQLNWEGISYVNVPERIYSADWCIQHDWPIFFTSDRDIAEAFMRRTLPNARAITWRPPYEVPGTGATEDKFISYYSQQSLSIVPGVLAGNLSVFSSIGRVTPDEPLQQKLPATYPVDKDKHYIAFYLNSGGNITYLQGRYLAETNRPTRSNWMNTEHDFPVSISMSLAAVDFAPLALRTLYGLKQAQDCFVTPFSGHSYIHPSQYGELDGFVDRLEHYLSLTDQHVIGIQENKSVEVDRQWVSQYGSKYFDLPAVSGLFVMNKPFGQVLWHGDKPVITKRFGMRIGDGDREENIRALAANLNRQVPDIQHDRGYSIIHVDLEQTSFEDMQQLVNLLQPHIKVVNLEELVYHVTTSVSH